MKKFILIFLLLGFTSIVTAKEIIDTDFFDVASFSNDDGEKDILFDTRKSSPYSYGISFVFYKPNTGWIICAPQNEKILVTNDSFQIIKTFPFDREDLPRMIFIDPIGWSIHSNYSEAVQVRDLKAMKTDYIMLRNMGQSPFYPLYFYDYDFYVTWAGKQFQGITNVLGLYAKKNIVISDNELKNGGETEKLRLSGFQFKSEVLNYRGFSISTSFKNFLHVTNWEQNKYRTIDAAITVDDTINGFYSGKYDDFDVNLLSIDLQGNYYWVNEPNCFVFNKNGELIYTLETPRSVNSDGSYKYTYRLAVHPSGDIYRFLMTGYKDPVKVQVLPNIWAPEAKKLWEQSKQAPRFITELSRGAFAYPFGIWKEAKINDSNVRMRQEPDLKSAVISHLSKETPVTVLEITPSKTKIDNVEAPWYLVRTWEGSQGWIFGAFMDIQN
jgi:hypothetical protein